MKESKAIPVTIKATSRVAIKIRDNFYTVEYSEERAIPEDRTIDMQFEREALWNDVNTCVDDRCAEILKTFKN